MHAVDWQCVPEAKINIKWTTEWIGNACHASYTRYYTV